MRILSNPNFNFIRWRWHALVLSGAIIVAGIATAIARGGLPLGVDFSGGTAVVLEFEKPTAEVSVRSAIAALNVESVVQRFGAETENRILVRLPMMEGVEQGTNLEEGARRVEEAVKAANIGTFKIASREIVGPVIGDDLKRKGVWATVFAIGGILVYIAIRFRFSFAVGAVAATFHDILVTLAFLMWAGYDLSLNVIAAILTITGYSVNDTIVVFDRVRENQRLLRREPLEQVVNRSVNQTLSRTIITAGTTFLAVLALYLFGGEVLRGMSFTLLVGIVTGTYSTVFVAAAVAILLSGKPPSQGLTQAQAQASARRKGA
jgi:preprotein translocase subunit SecF